MTHIGLQGRSPRGSSRTKHKVLAAALTAFAFSPFMAFASPQAAGGSPVAPKTQQSWAELEQLVGAELQSVVDKQRRIDGQSKLVKVSVKIDPAKSKLFINMSRGYVAKINGSEFEDLRSELTNTALHLIDPAIGIGEIEYLFDGRPLRSFYPEEAPPPSPQKKK
jgi:hypothetical protein